jgi:hypothetical protein
MSQSIHPPHTETTTITKFRIDDQMRFNSFFRQYLRFHFDRVHDPQAEPILVDGVVEAFLQCPVLRQLTNLPPGIEYQRLLLNQTLCKFSFSLCGRYILGVSPRQHQLIRGANPNIPFVEIESEPQSPYRLVRQMRINFPRARASRFQRYRFSLASLEFNPTHKLYRACVRGDTPGCGFTFRYKCDGKLSRCMFNDSWFKFGTFPMKIL